MISSSFLNKLPQDPGIYKFKDKKGNDLYIGKAKNIHKRVMQYFSSTSLWKKDMVHKAVSLEFIITGTEHEALLLEENLIRTKRPPYNNLIKGDSSYIYIKISNEEFPQVSLTRWIKSDGSLYLGPKQYRRELIKLLQVIRQFLKYRRCGSTEFKQGKLCSDFLFGICQGRCIYEKLRQKNADNYIKQAEKLGFTTNPSLNQALKDSQHLQIILKEFFEGNSDLIQEEILKQLKNAVEKQNFEWAAQLRDILINIKKFTEHQSIILTQEISGTVSSITQYGDYWIYVVVTFYKGKMIDVLQFKEQIDESDDKEILNNLELEYGKLKKMGGKDSLSLYVSSEFKNINSDTQNELTKLSQKFMESLVMRSSFEKQNIMQTLLQDLQKKYQLNYFPYVIECCDISHLGGGRMSGGLSHFEGGVPMKFGYRHYKIKTVDNRKSNYSDDYTAIKEVIIRKFGLTKTGKNDIEKIQNKPDIFIIDGGKGQLGVVQELSLEYPSIKQLISNIQFCALGKGQARKSKGRRAGNKEILYVLKPDFSMTEKKLNYDTTDQILIKVRDEAHRFANKYREKQMQNEFK